MSWICHHIILYYTFALFTVLHRFGGTFISFTLPDWHPMLRRPEDEINDKRSDRHPFLEAAFVSLSVITWGRVFFPCFSTIATSSHFPSCVGLQNGVFRLICRGQTTLQHGMELSVGRRAKPCHVTPMKHKTKTPSLQAVFLSNSCFNLFHTFSHTFGRAMRDLFIL